ncbi:MAG TPA: MFS transporter [Polyangia bacterium]|jgi:predicted MFS family arabinose efflux permease
MTSAQSLPVDASAARARLSDAAAFYLQASIIVSFLAGSIAPTPLYSVYQAAWGFSPITITVIFGIYAVAVLSALLVAGSLSDHVGRRPVLLVATLTQAATMLLFAAAGGVTTLIAARIIQGLATGAAVGAVGAGLLDLDRTKGTVANAVGPMTGTATGGLLSGLMIQYLPAPTHLVYLVLFVVFVGQGIGVSLMAESATPRPGALASLKPHIRVPVALRRPMLLAIPALVATWALAGFYGSLGPTLVRKILGSRSLAIGGLAVFVLAGSGALTVLLVRTRPARVVMSLGAVALAVGVALTLAAIPLQSGWVFFAGATIAGAGFGGGFQGAIRTVVPLARPEERAGVLSALYIVSYLAMGLPAVLGGLRVVHGGGLLTTAREYGIGVILLAVLALLGGVLGRAPAPRR